MAGNLNQAVANIPDRQTQTAFRNLAMYAYDQLSSNLLKTGTLAIKAGGSAVVKASAALVAIIRGILVTKVANTDMAALAGTVTNAKFNVYVFFVDAAGTLTSAMGTEAATLAGVKWPDFPNGRTTIGFIIVNPTGTGNFVGGTTALDDATVVPNVVYVDAIGGFDPTATYTF